MCCASAWVTTKQEPPVVASPIRVQLYGGAEQLLVCYKPATIPVHACGAHRHASLVNLLAALLPRDGGNEDGSQEGADGVPLCDHTSPTSLHIVHRIDRLTSGLVLLARTPARARELTAQFAARQVSNQLSPPCSHAHVSAGPWHVFLLLAVG